MIGRLRSHLRNQWLGALALFLVVAGGGAYAAFDPIGPDGDVDACYQKKSGDLDLRKGKRCGKKEKPVSWSEVGPQGEPGPPGETGATGAPGTALAFARVNADGTVDQARSKNIASSNVTRPSDGVYCFDGLDFTPLNVVATPETGNRTFNVFGLVDDAGGCPGIDEDFMIVLRDIRGPTDSMPGVPQNGPFYVMVN